MKKVLLLTIATIVAISLTACGSNKESEQSVAEGVAVESNIAETAPVATEAKKVEETTTVQTGETYQAPIAKETKDSSETLQIIDIKSVTTTITDDSGNECPITIKTPIFGSEDPEEAEVYNDDMYTYMSEIEEMILEKLDSYEEAPKSASINSCEITSINKKSAVLTIKGEIIPASGGRVPLTYTINFDRTRKESSFGY